MCYTTESYEDDISVLRQINPNIIALDEKTLEAERRSYHTFFDVHVVETRDGYILIEEGDYGELPMHLIDQIANVRHFKDRHGIILEHVRHRGQQLVRSGENFPQGVLSAGQGEDEHQGDGQSRIDPIHPKQC